VYTCPSMNTADVRSEVDSLMRAVSVCGDSTATHLLDAVVREVQLDHLGQQVELWREGLDLVRAW
jgi:hypothetical protein